MQCAGRDKSVEVVTVLGMFEDITDRRHMEVGIQASLQGLERLRMMLKKEDN